jgi:hypothetical protein
MTGPRLLAAFIVLVVLSVGVGLYLVGPRSETRDRLMDERRVQDLTEISRRVDLFWTREGTLPASLAALERQSAGSVPKDPGTNQPYDYRPLGAIAYELCAQFQRTSSDRGQEPGFWSHQPGRQCFQPEAQRVRP